ncbi:hypothetical protein Pmani_031545 [Petrolisthes manimaculis]|uniref:Uncharacterized protein n=1 Tax=Petrolisthes manimaculis TaxID=1843537 RepID=A0AAE1NUY1_9EUCA|nr:hypothetical protein Pmani_031545 [Petrolisthes manimaculis]
MGEEWGGEIGTELVNVSDWFGVSGSGSGGEEGWKRVSGEGRVCDGRGLMVMVTVVVVVMVIEGGEESLCW